MASLPRVTSRKGILTFTITSLQFCLMHGVILASSGSSLNTNDNSNHHNSSNTGKNEKSSNSPQRVLAQWERSGSLFGPEVRASTSDLLWCMPVNFLCLPCFSEFACSCMLHAAAGMHSLRCICSVYISYQVLCDVSHMMHGCCCVPLWLDSCRRHK